MAVAVVGLHERRGEVVGRGAPAGRDEVGEVVAHLGGAPVSA
ncbi:hypothetical protein B0E53_06672 [Micromonospora sp. MH33]|nr:hypothetical protein B0E53_06672 [Micromonospora sp. MH33]